MGTDTTVGGQQHPGLNPTLDPQTSLTIGELALDAFISRGFTEGDDTLAYASTIVARPGWLFWFCEPFCSDEIKYTVSCA